MNYLKYWRYAIAAIFALGIGIIVAPESQKSKDEYNQCIDREELLRDIAIGSLEILEDLESFEKNEVLLQMKIYDLGKKADEYKKLSE